MGDDSVMTVPFRISPASYASVIMRRWLARWWWAVILLPAAAVGMALATTDIRYLLLALVLLCLVIPPAMMIVYYYYALDPQAHINIPLHTVGCDGRYISVNFVSGEAGDEEETIPDCADSVAKEYVAPPPPVVIPLESVKWTARSGGRILIDLTDGKVPPLLVVPYSAFPDNTSLRLFISML